MKKALKTLAVILGTLLLLMGGVTLLLYHELNDEHLGRNTRMFLSEVLGTEVELKDAKFHPLEKMIAIYGFNVKDRDSVDMLHVDTLEARLDFWQLLHSKVVINGIDLAGANAVIYKTHKDTASNYQFVIDAMKFVGKEKEEAKQHEKESIWSRKTIFIDLRQVSIRRTSATWDVRSAKALNTPYHKQIDANHLCIDTLMMTMSLHSGGAPGSFVGTLKELSVRERNSGTSIAMGDIDFDSKNVTLTMGSTDLHYQDKHVRLGNLKVDRDDEQYHLTIGEIAFQNGIGVAKTGEPKKGAFDARHVNMLMTLDATATCITADSLAMNITRLSGKDKTSGLVLDNISMQLDKNHEKSVLRNVDVKSGHNHVRTDRVDVRHYYDHRDTPFTFTTSTVHCQSLLKDIAHAFAPALQNFTTPVYCTTTITGDNKGMTFHGIRVNTRDHRLSIAAEGWLKYHVPTGRKEDHKGKAALSFTIDSMQACGGIKEQILSHFNLKPKTLDFIRNLGDISFSGRVDLPHRKQIICGVLSTCYGSFDADVTLNSDTHYLSGTLTTQDFGLGKYIGNQNIGDVSLTAEVTMDLSHSQQGQHSKIPAGTIKGRAMKASYKKITIHNVDYSIVSDATVARGTLSTTGKVMDISCDFSFDEMDVKHSLKVKPHIKIHKKLKTHGEDQ